VDVRVHEPLADADQALEYYGVRLSPIEDMMDLCALIIAVPHNDYRQMAVSDFKNMLVENGCLIDVKSMLDIRQVKQSGLNYWRL
jgi:UDP-N-acetyl-D-galactosamine dehydrogenase